MRRSGSTELGNALVSFFQEHLPEQRGLSQHSIRSYRDALVLLLQFIAKDTKRGVESDLTVAQAERFLTHLEKERGNGIFTRNARLAAIQRSPDTSRLDIRRGWVNSRRSSPYRSSEAFGPHQSSIWKVRMWRRRWRGLIDARSRGSGTTRCSPSCVTPAQGSRKFVVYM